MLDVPSTNAPVVVSAILLAPLFEKLTAPLKLLFCVSVMAFAPDVKLEVPVTVATPLCVMAPLVVTAKMPEIVDAANANAFASTNVTLLPVVMPTDAKSLEASSSVILLPDPAAKVDAPETVKAPLSVIAPAVVTLNVPDIVDALRAKAFASTNVTLLPEVIPTDAKSFEASSSVILLPDPAAKVDAPETVKAPLSVIAPAVVTFNVPDIVDALSANAFASTNVALLPVVIPTDAKSLDASSSVILLPDPAAKVEAPATLNAPLSVIAPAVVTFNVPDMVDALRANAFASTNVTLLPDVIPTLAKSLDALSSVMLILPATKVDEPETVNAPLCVTAPPAVIFKSPVIDKPDNPTAALL